MNDKEQYQKISLKDVWEKVFIKEVEMKRKKRNKSRKAREERKTWWVKRRQAEMYLGKIAFLNKLSHMPIGYRLRLCGKILMKRTFKA